MTWGVAVKYKKKKTTDRWSVCNGLCSDAEKNVTCPRFLPVLRFSFIFTLLLGNWEKRDGDHFKPELVFILCLISWCLSPPAFRRCSSNPGEACRREKVDVFPRSSALVFLNPNTRAKSEACRVSALTKKACLCTRETERPKLWGRIVREQSSL